MEHGAERIGTTPTATTGAQEAVCCALMAADAVYRVFPRPRWSGHLLALFANPVPPGLVCNGATIHAVFHPAPHDPAWPSGIQPGPQAGDRLRLRILEVPFMRLPSGVGTVAVVERLVD